MSARFLRGALAALPLICAAAMPVPAFAQEVPSDFTEIVAELSPAVVAVVTRRTVDTRQMQQQMPPQLPRQLPPGMLPEPFGMPPSPDQQPEAQALGSGFIISEQGHIVTNNHVIQDASEIEVLLADGSSQPAELIGSDSATDIAVLQIDPPENIAVAGWGDSDTLRPGAWTIAIGSPFGLGGTVTVGVLSARSRQISSDFFGDFLQTDASINRGNSGGPLFNVAGEVIGVNTAIFSPIGANIGIGFAVPSNTAQHIVSQIIETGTVRRGFLGVSLQPLTDALARALGLDSAEGALVAQIEPNSPAESAGINEGDAILAIDGSQVADPRELARAIAEREPGSEITLSVHRNGETTDVELTLGERQTEQAATTPTPSEEQGEGQLGLAVTEVPELLRRQFGLESGVIVQNVAPGGPAAQAGIQQGDVIVEAGGEPVEAAADLATAWEAARNEQRPALLRVNRGESSLFIAVETASGEATGEQGTE